MARTVSVKITGDASGLVAAFGKSAAAAQAAAGRISKAIGDNDQNISKVSTGLGVIGLAAAAGVGVAVKSFADFDAAMSGVAATGADARASLSELRDAAIQAGAETKYSATEAAGGIEALAKAGVSAKDALGGGLDGALNLAAAGNLGVAESAEVAASAMNQFGLAGQDIPHVADLLAQAAGTAQGEVSDMAGALNQSGLIANQFGLSIDETAQALALFAKNGLVGSDAGTSFKTMLSQLYAPSGTAATALKDLGVSAYDAAGGLKPIGVLTDDLKGKLDDLSAEGRNKALKDIFGSDAIRAGTILLKDGSQGLADMAEEFGKFGSAADVAAIKMGNLKGDLEGLQGSFETAMIGLGEGANGPLRSLVQGATDAVNVFNDLGDGSKSALLAVGGGLAAIALGAAGLGKIATFANEAKNALTGLGITARSAGIAVGLVGAAIGIAAIGFGAYAANAAESRARVDDFTTALQGQTDAIAQNVQAVAAKQLLENDGLAAARELGLSLETVTQAALGNADALEQVGKATDFWMGKKGTTDEYEQSVQDKIGASEDLIDALRTTGSEYDKAVQDANDLAAATGKTIDAAQPDAYSDAADALGKIGDEASDAAGGVEELTAALFEQANAAIGLSNAQVGYEAAVDAASKAAKENGKNLKAGSEAGRENLTALNNLAGASQRYIQDLTDQGAGTKKIVGATKDARAAFIETATAMTGSASKAKALADQYGLIPKKVETQVDAKAEKARTDLAQVKNAIKGLPKKQQTEIVAAFKKGGLDAAESKLQAITKERKANIRAQANGDAAVKRRLDEAAKDRKSQIKVTDVGTGKASGDISEAARARRAAINVQAAGVGAANAAINSAARDRTSHINVITTKSTRLADNDKAYGGVIPGSSPHMRADNILINATAGEYMQDVPAHRFWGTQFMDAVLARNVEAVAALVGTQSKAYGGPVATVREVPTYATSSFNYALAAQGASERPVVQPQITQVFPSSADPLAAAAASGGWTTAALQAIGA